LLKNTTVAILFSLGVLGLAGCDVKKTQEGNLTLPKVEVKKIQDGNVTLPKYQVTPPEVTVSTTEKTLTVPVIKKEEKTIEVPKVTITPAK
jgi:uncharacterized lipoprotein